ncbi:MAG: PadR family transcriptional regulator [Acidobacteriia bacterium]|nr:PadR family transcriptional regulator [Terriglobia bacterium]
MVRIDAQIKRGSAELAILALLNQQPSHGYEISKRIAQQTGGILQFNLASLYPLLYRLEKRGWVKGKWEEAKSGRKRRYYHLTRAGKKQLAPLREEWGLFFRALHRIAGVANAG